MVNPLGHPIAYGRTAEIYAWENGQVLKLFYDWFDLENIQHELRVARAVQASGLPVPRVGEIIQVNGRNGLTYQRIEGISMLKMIARKPWNLIRYAKRMADLHAALHAAPFQADLPRVEQALANKISREEALSAQQRSQLAERLKALPIGDRLCHGDFHPDNILMMKAGEMVIDWIDAGIGNPLADVARTTVIFEGALGANQLKNAFLNASLRIFHRVYLRRYFALRPGGETEYRRWVPIIAAARLSEHITELEGWLIGQVEKSLADG